MIEYTNGNKTAIIVLHEIYGVNDFIKDRCRQYLGEGYDVFCPQLFCNGTVFSYDEEKNAYHAYQSEVGFNAYQEINLLASNLKNSYSKVFVIGFSAGATLAWRCSENPIFDGVICCYGSRIRDCLAVNPQCHVLLIFAKHETFDVLGTVTQLREKKDTTLEILDAKHGFADCYSKNYCQEATALMNRLRQIFLTSHTG